MSLDFDLEESLELIPEENASVKGSVQLWGTKVLESKEDGGV